MESQRMITGLLAGGQIGRGNGISFINPITHVSTNSIA
jgi:hypothetical protein